MKGKNAITTLFLDVGGVLLSNGWGHEFRQLAAEKFHLNMSEMESRHKLVVVAFEEGKVTMEQYLHRVVFYKERDFTMDQFRHFMLTQTTSYPNMMDLIKRLKQKYQLKIVVVSNEARELNEYRIKTFFLNSFVDVFISSCYVHLRKPDNDIFHMALDIAQAKAEQVVYIEDLQLFIEVAADLGIKGIQHNNYQSTIKKLTEVGLTIDQE